MTREDLDENTKLVKFFCNKKKEQLTVYISNPDSSLYYMINKDDCEKIHVSITKPDISTLFYLSEQNIYTPLKKYDSLIINKLIYFTDSLGWCNDALKNGKSLMLMRVSKK